MSLRGPLLHQKRFPLHGPPREVPETARDLSHRGAAPPARDRATSRSTRRSDSPVSMPVPDNATRRDEPSRLRGANPEPEKRTISRLTPFVSPLTPFVSRVLVAGQQQVVERDARGGSRVGPLLHATRLRRAPQGDLRADGSVEGHRRGRHLPRPAPVLPRTPPGKTLPRTL